MTTNLALIGRKSQDRTFVAEWLEYAHGFKRMRMDDGIRKFMTYMYGYGSYVRPHWETKEKMYDAVYTVDPTIHINYLFRKMERVKNKVVVSDVKYISELQLLRSRGFIIVRISSPAAKHIKRSAAITKSPAGTLSMAEMFYDPAISDYSADYTILNENRENTKKLIADFLDRLGVVAV